MVTFHKAKNSSRAVKRYTHSVVPHLHTSKAQIQSFGEILWFCKEKTTQQQRGQGKKQSTFPLKREEDIFLNSLFSCVKNHSVLSCMGICFSSYYARNSPTCQFGTRFSYRKLMLLWHRWGNRSFWEGDLESYKVIEKDNLVQENGHVEALKVLEMMSYLRVAQKWESTSMLEQVK